MHKVRRPFDLVKEVSGAFIASNILVRPIGLQAI